MKFSIPPPMRILVIGSGGRESAIVRGLRFAPSVTEIHCVPGNPGIARHAICHNLDTSSATFLSFVQKMQFDCVVVGPEQPLVDGLTDRLREIKIPVFGPSRQAANLEGSKIFCKEFLVRAGIPTAQFRKVTSVQELVRFQPEFKPPFVLKADGLAAGKGVFICKNAEELLRAGRELFEDKKLGAAGEHALLEEHMDGWELSYLVISNGKEFQKLPLAQDHKRLMDDDHGPNTGGMGAVAPISISKDLDSQIENLVLRPFHDQLQKENLDYRGVIYFGLMMTARGPRVLEINARFGDPETQVLLPLLDGDWGQVFKKVALGEMPELKWKSLFSACVVLAANGYPESPSRGDVIDSNIFDESPSSYFLCAGVGLNSSKEFVTAGGRILSSVGMGSTLKDAIARAYEQVSKVTWPGMFYRKDIGKKQV